MNEEPVMPKEGDGYWNFTTGIIYSFVDGKWVEKWKLVPMEPTKEMVRAGQQSSGRSTSKNMESPAQIYKDMLAAAPDPSRKPFGDV